MGHRRAYRIKNQILTFRQINEIIRNTSNRRATRISEKQTQFFAGLLALPCRIFGFVYVPAQNEERLQGPRQLPMCGKDLSTPVINFHQFLIFIYGVGTFTNLKHAAVTHSASIIVGNTCSGHLIAVQHLQHVVPNENPIETRTFLGNITMETDGLHMRGTCKGMLPDFLFDHRFLGHSGKSTDLLICFSQMRNNAQKQLQPPMLRGITAHLFGFCPHIARRMGSWNPRRKS